MLEQKLDYIHVNPLQQYWDLVDVLEGKKFILCYYSSYPDHRKHHYTIIIDEVFNFVCWSKPRIEK